MVSILVLELLVEYCRSKALKICNKDRAIIYSFASTLYHSELIINRTSLPSMFNNLAKRSELQILQKRFHHRK